MTNNNNCAKIYIRTSMFKVNGNLLKYREKKQCVRDCVSAAVGALAGDIMFFDRMNKTEGDLDI